MRTISGAVIVVFFLGVVLSAQPPEDALVARVSLVVDGDTIVLDNGDHVRYLGIDTPEEGEPLYWAAKRFNRTLVWRKSIYLEVGEEGRDGYGRLLAYVWVERNGAWILVNEEILRKGLARLLVVWPDHHYERLLKALTWAQVEKRGLWAKYREPLTLSEVEAEPQKYVTEAITVSFQVGSIEIKEREAVIRAAHSRYGFHIIVELDTLKSLELPPDSLEGSMLCVSGELRWENLARGPFIQVIIPAQLDISRCEEKTSH